MQVLKTVMEELEHFQNYLFINHLQLLYKGAYLLLTKLITAHCVSAEIKYIPLWNILQIFYLW